MMKKMPCVRAVTAPITQANPAAPAMAAPMPSAGPCPPIRVTVAKM